MIVIEINLLLDRLEALLVESRPFLLTSNVIVDRERCFDLINQMRVSIPEEVKKAQRVYRDRDRVIAQANEEAERITALAHEQAAERVSGHEIIHQAEERAQTIIERAQREADEMQSAADLYVRDVLRQLAQQLDELEKQLVGQITIVRNGIAKLDGTIEKPES